MKKFTSQKQKIGERGEKIAEMFLVKQGFSILEKNFNSKFGEIDIICKKSGKFHFIEVKLVTVSYETLIRNKKMSVWKYDFEQNLVSCVTPEETQVLHENIKETPVSYETGEKTNKNKVSRETFLLEIKKLRNPFENVSYKKIKCLLKTIEIYMSFKGVSYETKWQLDGVGIYLVPETNICGIEYIENIMIR